MRAPAKDPRSLLFPVVLVCLGLAVGLVLAEGGLRWHERRVVGSDRMDPGLFEYEPTLGWRLTPGWTGGHRHYDFATRYAVNRLGFRADTRFADDRPARLVAVLGDSFTFGFGVGDDQTFVHRLDAALRPGAGAANFATPGTSTDQQALLLERRIVHFKPARVLVVVYLGNDLVDNPRPFPIHAPNPKPYFEEGPEGLILRHVPVPKTHQPVVDTQGELRRAVVGDLPTAAGPRGGLLPRSALWRRLAAAAGEEPDYSAALTERLGPALRLFYAIVARMERACGDAGADLALALLPGRSYLDRPNSLSARFQEHLRAEIVRESAARGWEVIDVAAALRERHRGAGPRWYYPNEGHLTPEGHRVVAEILGESTRLS